jgi:hypothetical protein
MRLGAPGADHRAALAVAQSREHAVAGGTKALPARELGG